MESHIDEAEMNMRDHLLCTKESKKIDHLPTEIISDILSRLPVKTLSRFKCVCKLWCNLISNPYFHLLHHQRSQKRNPLQLFSTNCCDDENNGAAKYFLRLSSVDDNSKPHDECILSKCRSDYVISSHNSSLVCFVNITEDARVCNPGTNEILTLPKGSHCVMGLNNYIVGFGYLPLTNEYKVVRLFFRHLESLIDEYFHNFEIRCEILTLGDGGIIGHDGDARPPSWTILEDELCPYPVVVFYPPFLNEAVHWLIHEEYYMLHTDDLDHNGELIVSFNVRTEKFKMILKPEGCLSDDMPSMNLAELRGFLVLVSRGESIGKLDIWVLKDYENQLWLKEYRIDLTWIDGFDPDDFMWAIPRDIKDGELLIETDVAGMRLGYYNIETQSFRRVINPKSGEIFKFNYYWESFFSLGTR